MNKVFTFLEEVRAEFQKMTWPSRPEFLGSVIVVLIVMAFFSVILGGMDSFFSSMLKRILS